MVLVFSHRFSRASQYCQHCNTGERKKHTHVKEASVAGGGFSIEQKALARTGRTGKKERWYARGMKRDDAAKKREEGKAAGPLNRAI